MLEMRWLWQPAMNSAFFVLTAIVLLTGARAQQSLPDAPSATKAKSSRGVHHTDNGWPRTFTSGEDRFTIYQPQVDSWDGNRIHVYSAVELQDGKNKSAKYGVVWLQARTEVDKVNREVTLNQVKVTKVKFPAAAEKEHTLVTLLQTKLPAVTKTVSLDRLEAAVDLDNELIKAVEVKNEPPKIITQSKPSLLILVDGKPQMRQLPDTELEQVINTKSTLLFSPNQKLYYLRVKNWWMQSAELEGPWNRVRTCQKK